MDFPSFLSFSPSSEDPDWAWLPEPILYLILSHLILLSDLSSFGKVCSRWRSVLQFRLQDLCISSNMSFTRRLPMLLIPTFDSIGSSRNLYSLPDASIYNLRLSVPYKNRCIGSSHGWLIFIDSLSFVITLFNPFYFGSSKGTICLPKFLPAVYAKMMANEFFGREFFPDYYIPKAVLSSDPSSHPNDFILVVIHDEMRSTAFYNSADGSWTYLNNYLRGIFDVISGPKSFLAVNYWGEVFLCDVESNCVKIRLAAGPVMGPMGASTRRYIAQTDDGILLQAVRLVETITHGAGECSILRTIGFLVYSLRVWGQCYVWMPVRHIGNGALFIGDNHSSYVRATKNSRILPNAIYFTDDFPDVCTLHSKPYEFMGHCDIGIYLIHDQIFKKHHVSPPWHKLMPPPIWLFPTV